MNTKKLASITFSWDEFGNISHILNSFIPVNDYKKQDALALSVPIVISSQLGILNIRSAIELCGNCLNFLSTSNSTILAIPAILRSVRVELHQKGKTIVETFHPEIINSTDETKEYENAILRFHNNYVIYAHDYVIDELAEYLKHSLLMTIYFYVDEILPKIIELPTFSLDNYSRDVQYTMLDFSETIYPNWGGLLPKSSFKEIIGKTQKQLQYIRSRLL